MAKYRANPVVVEAFEIEGMSEFVPDDGLWVNLRGGGSTARHISAGMVSRFMPKVGDYLVIQDDGYAYLNPREVFKRKYSPVIDDCYVVGCKVIGPHSHEA